MNTGIHSNVSTDVVQNRNELDEKVTAEQHPPPPKNLTKAEQIKEKVKDTDFFDAFFCKKIKRLTEKENSKNKK